MRLPPAAHTRQRWRIHEITPDFQLQDVWALPTPGGPDDFPRLVEIMASFDPGQASSLPVRGLFLVRSFLGGLLGWDRPQTGIGRRVPSLRDRLKPDLVAPPADPAREPAPFTTLYRLGDEWALEIANQTVHGVLHLGWVPDGAGGYRGQMAVLVKRNGLLGQAYMAAITPFRHLIVYPTILGDIERRWRERAGDVRPAAA